MCSFASSEGSEIPYGVTEIIFFRAVSLIIHGTQDKHLHIRESLMTFVERNTNVFQAYVKPGTSIAEHITTMRREGTWGTELELFAAASFCQLPFHVCWLHAETREYKWLEFPPEDPAQLTFEGGRPEKPALRHAELCNTNGDHYDTVITIDKRIPTSPPTQLQNT